MVVRGRLRGNGSQLANYLLNKADNDNVQLLEIIGTSQEGNLRKALLEMSLTSELTKSDKGLFHVQICPAYGEDKQMTSNDWKRAADIMEQETGYTGQKRAIVLHEKKGKIHAHVVWERYNHEKGIMIPNKFSRLAQDRARMSMERELEHARTPERNKQRPEMKAFLSNLWERTQDGGSFVKAVAENGYVITTGTQRPYMVIDQTGRSFNLVRQLRNIKTSEVRSRLKDTKLIKEKEAIERMRLKSNVSKTTNDIQNTKPKYHNNNNERRNESTGENDEKLFTLHVSFNITSESNMESLNQLKSAITNAEYKQMRKKELAEKLKQERLRRAKEFRENERDL